VIPDEYEFLKFREKDNDNALPWDEIQKSEYTRWKSGYDLNEIKVASEQRIKNNVAFSTILNNAKWLGQQNDKTYSLNLEKFRQEQKAIKTTVKQTDSLEKALVELPVEGLKADEAKYNNVDKDKGERYTNWLKNLRKDIYISEATNIVKDMIAKSSALVKASNN
jgi:carboxyl-terminal processing protease